MWMTTAQVLRHLNVSRHTLNKLMDVETEKVPYVQIGGSNTPYRWERVLLMPGFAR